MEEHIYIFFINYINETNFLLTAVIINENKATRKVCDMKSFCYANKKTLSLNKSAYTNFQLP